MGYKLCTYVFKKFDTQDIRHFFCMWNYDVVNDKLINCEQFTLEKRDTFIATDNITNICQDFDGNWVAAY